MLVSLELYYRCLFLFFQFLTDITPEAEVTLWNKFFMLVFTLHLVKLSIVQSRGGLGLSLVKNHPY